MAISSMLTFSLPSTAAQTGLIRSSPMPSNSAISMNFSGLIATISWANTVLSELRVARTRLALPPEPPRTLHRPPQTWGFSMSRRVGASHTLRTGLPFWSHSARAIGFIDEPAWRPGPAARLTLA